MLNKLFFTQLLFPPKCVGCKTRFDIIKETEADYTAFCRKCRADWEWEKLNSCPGCGVAAIECTCTPKILDKKYVDCISLVKFGRSQKVDRLIYSLKKRKVERNFEFAADELAKRFESYASTTDEKLESVIITNVPRKRSTVAALGFDHAKILAELIAEKTGYPYLELVLRVGLGRDQKKLSLQKRRENVKGKFDIAVEGDLSEYTVVLVDDVVTSGTTAYECIKVLRSAGVKKVILLSIARAFEKKTAKRKSRGKQKKKN